jgi:hypothetical protein
MAKKKKKDKKGVYDEKTSTDEEIDDAKQQVAKGAVAVSNKSGESDASARERVGAAHPGKPMVDETKVGSLENPNEEEKPKVVESKPKRKVKDMDEMIDGKPISGSTATPDDYKDDSDKEDLKSFPKYSDAMFGRKDVTSVIFPIADGPITNFKFRPLGKDILMIGEWKGPIIGDFSNGKEFYLAQIKLDQDILSAYARMFMDFKTERNEFIDARRIVASKMGINVVELQRTSSDEDSKVYSGILKSMVTRVLNDPLPLKRFEQYSVCVHPQELSLQQSLHDIAWRENIGFEPFFDFFKGLGTEDSLIRTPEDSGSIKIDRNLLYGAFPWKGDVYIKLLRNRTNTLLRDELLMNHLSLVDTKLKVSLVDEAKVGNSLNAAAGLSVTTYNEAQSLTRNLSPKKGVDLLVKLIAVYLMGDMAEIRFTKPSTSAETAIAAAMWRLMPKDLFSIEAREMTGNAFLQSWILKGQDAKDPSHIKSADLATLDRDYLIKYLDDGVIRGGRRYSTFFRRWGDYGAPNPVSVSTVKGHNRFMGTLRRYLFWQWFGMLGEDRHIQAVELTQVLNQMEMERSTYPRQTKTSITKWLEYLVNGVNYQVFNDNLVKFLRSLGMLPVVYPMKGPKMINSIKITVPFNSIISLLGLVRVDESTRMSLITKDDIFASWSRFVSANWFTYWFQRYREIPKFHMKSTEAGQRAITHCNYSPSFERALDNILKITSIQNLIGVPNARELPQFMTTSLNLVKRFKMAMSQYFQFTTRFYIGNNMVVRGNYSDRFIRRWVYKGQKIVLRLDLTDIKTMDTLHQLYDHIQDNLTSDGIIEIKSFVKFKLKEIQTVADIPQFQAPLGVDEKQNTLKVWPIDVTYITGDKIANRNTGIMFLAPTKLAVAEFPIIDIDPSVVRRWVQPLRVLRKGIELIDSSWYSFVTKSNF